MDDFDINIRGLVGLLRRQLRLIVITIVVVVGLTALVVFSLTPIYTASALVLVDTAQKNLLAADFMVGNTGTDNARVASEMEIMQSESILLRVVQQLNLVSDTEFGVKLGLSDRILAFLQIAKPSLPTGQAALQSVLGNVNRAMSIQRRGYTNVIALQVRAEYPAKAADVANAWATAYIADQISAKIDSTLASRDILQGRLAEARDAVVKSEGALDTFIDDNLGKIVDETGRTDISDIRQRLNDVSAQRARDAALAVVAQSSLQQRNWEALAENLQSDALRELERQREALSKTLETRQSDTIELRAELARVEQQLVDAAAGELTTLRQAINTNQSREADLRQQLRTTVLSGALSPDLVTGVYGLQQGAELARQQYQTLLARIQDYDAQAGLQVADSRIVSPARPPSGKSFPNTSLSLILAAIIATGLGITLAFVYEHLVGGMLTEDQTEAVLKISVAAAVPRSKPAPEGSGSGGGLPDQLVSAPFSTFSEAIRRIKVVIDQASQRRTTLRKRPIAQPALIVMVTSSTAGEGKSTIALALARAYALSHRSVLLIDGDFRKPSIQKLIGLVAKGDMTELLSTGQKAPDLMALIDEDPLSGAKVIIGSRSATVPTDELIGSESFAHLLEMARGQYGVVVVDTPPVGPVVDALYVAALADVILFVVKSGSTSQTEARMALASVLKAKGESSRLLAVLNQQERASAYYKGKYDSYYFSETA